MSQSEEKLLFNLRVYEDGCKTDVDIHTHTDIQQVIYSLVSMFEQAPHIRAVFELALDSAKQLDELADAKDGENNDPHLFS
ncbi:MAG: hypothetical protein ACRDAO_08100 [Culicoidibacterales bacterium]